MKTYTQKAEEVLEHFFPGQDFFINEQLSEMEKMLDVQAGIDAFIKKASILYPIALRIQTSTDLSKMKYNKDWPRTFTIRYKLSQTGNMTEYSKRLEAIKLGSLYPLYTIQAYYHNDIFINAAIIETKEFYNWLIKNPTKVHLDHNKNCKDDNEFKYIYWDDLSEWPDQCITLIEF